MTLNVLMLLSNNAITVSMEESLWFFVEKEIEVLQGEHLLSTTFNFFRCSVVRMSSSPNSKNCFRHPVVLAFLVFCISIRVDRVASSFVASTTEMSASSNCPSDDVLCEIFRTLDVPDLLSCTKVCKKWRCVIESLVLGRRLFQQMKKSSAAWRRAWRKLARDETNLKPEDYKNICWFCLQYLEKVDGNWRAGSYQWKTTLSTFECTVIRFAHGEDFITVYSDDNEHVQIYDRETLKLKRNFRPNYPEYRIMDLNTVVYLESNGLAIHNINTGQLIRRFKLNESPPFKLDACCARAKLWTVLAEFESVLRLTLWTVDNAWNVALIKTIEVQRSGHDEFQVDEQFILHEQSKRAGYRMHQTVHFISTGTVHDNVLETSLSVMSRWRFEYDRGLMFFFQDQLIRILDVASGTYLHDIDMGESRWIVDIKANLNYVVIIAESDLYVYSLQALRNPLPKDAFVSKIEDCYSCSTAEDLDVAGDLDVAVDETQIVCLTMSYYESDLSITVSDFGYFEQTPTPPWMLV